MYKPLESIRQREARAIRLYIENASMIEIKAILDEIIARDLVMCFEEDKNTFKDIVSCVVNGGCVQINIK